MVTSAELLQQQQGNMKNMQWFISRRKKKKKVKQQSLGGEGWTAQLSHTSLNVLKNVQGAW